MSNRKKTARSTIVIILHASHESHAVRKNFDEIYAKDRSWACWIFPLTLAQNICDTSYHQSYISNKWFFNWTSNFRARNDAGTQTPNQHTRGILGTSMSMSTECDVMWRAQWGLQNEQAKKQSHWCGVNHSNLLDLIVYRWFNKISAWWNGVFFLYVVDSKPGWSWLVQQNVICGHERLWNGCQRRSEVSGRKNLKNWLLGIFSISTLPVFSRDLHSRLPRFFHHHLPTLQLVFAWVFLVLPCFYTFNRSPCLPFFLWSFLWSKLLSSNLCKTAWRPSPQRRERRPRFHAEVEKGRREMVFQGTFAYGVLWCSQASICTILEVTPLQNSGSGAIWWYLQQTNRTFALGWFTLPFVP